ncbi:uncharacterized protein LOC144428071 [Styela clava]
MAFKIWIQLIFIAFINMHCKAASLKIKIGDPCGNPYGSRRWIYKDNIFGCYQCDARYYWDSYNNKCSACTGSLTSCQQNVMTNACNQHERLCESMPPSATTRNDLTDQATTNTPSFFTLINTVKTSVKHIENTHQKTGIYIIIAVLALLLLVIIATFIKVYKHRISQQSKNNGSDNVTDSDESLLENSQV